VVIVEGSQNFLNVETSEIEVSNGIFDPGHDVTDAVWCLVLRLSDIVPLQLHKNSKTYTKVYIANWIS